MPVDRAVEEVARVELDPRLGGEDLERAAALRLDDPGDLAQLARLAAQHEVVVVAAAALQLLVGRVDARADRCRLAEVERRAVDRLHLAGRDQRRVDRREAVGLELQLVAEDRALALAGQVEVGVVREVDDRRRVGRRRVVDDEPAVRRAAE